MCLGCVLRGSTRHSSTRYGGQGGGGVCIDCTDHDAALWNLEESEVRLDPVYGKNKTLTITADVLEQTLFLICSYRFHKRLLLLI